MFVMHVLTFSWQEEARMSLRPHLPGLLTGLRDGLHGWRAGLGPGLDLRRGRAEDEPRDDHVGKVEEEHHDTLGETE